MNNHPVLFNGYEVGQDFDRARTQIATPFQAYDLALDVADSNRIIEIAGDFLYFDTASGFDGIVAFELNNEHTAPMAPFTGRPGFAINALFKKLKVSWAAQPGKKVRILYSTGERVIPALAGTLTVTGTVATLEDPMSYGSVYKSNTNMAANTPDTIFTPAANVNGAIIHAATALTIPPAGAYSAGFIAKTSAPANILDGDLIITNINPEATGTYPAVVTLPKPLLIAPGKGFYWLTTGAETGSLRSVLYTLK